MNPSRVLCIFAWLAVTSPAFSHHSYAMFDGSKRPSASAVVARLEWRNPHVFLWLHVARPTGEGYDLVALESDSVNILTRLGWKPELLPAGVVVKASWYPLRDGRAGGHLIDVELPDGVVLRGAAGPINGIAAQSRAAGTGPAGERP